MTNGLEIQTEWKQMKQDVFKQYRMKPGFTSDSVQEKEDMVRMDYIVNNTLNSIQQIIVYPKQSEEKK